MTQLETHTLANSTIRAYTSADLLDPAPNAFFKVPKKRRLRGDSMATGEITAAAGKGADMPCPEVPYTSASALTPCAVMFVVGLSAVGLTEDAA